MARSAKRPGVKALDVALPQAAKLRVSSHDRLRFGPSALAADATAFRRLMHHAQQAGLTGFTLDFSATRSFEPIAMAQLVVHTSACRAMGMHFDVITPDERKVSEVFRNNNWAHHLSPVNFEPFDKQPNGWLPVVRYTNPDELSRIVDSTCKAVLREAHVQRPALHGLEWALNEIADNVFQHADTPDGGLVAVSLAKKRRRVQFVVADSGCGIPTTMRTTRQKLTDAGAIRLALKQGVTRDRAIGAGNGLAGTLRIARAGAGSFSVQSGKSLVRAHIYAEGFDTRNFKPRDALNGTLVVFEVATDRHFDLEQALLEDGIGISDFDYLDAAYAPDERDVVVVVADEVSSTATRRAGTPVRKLARNLYFSAPDAKIIIDFTGVERVTASFADEVVGKLLVSLGPARFRSRVVVDGFDDPLVRGQVFRALTQRQEEAVQADERRRRDKSSKARFNRRTASAPTSRLGGNRRP